MNDKISNFIYENKIEKIFLQKKKNNDKILKILLAEKKAKKKIA